jgi:tetratricopeptide (TPR) repeat protein
MGRIGRLCAVWALLFPPPAPGSAAPKDAFEEMIRRGIEILRRADEEWSLEGFREAAAVFQRSIEQVPRDERGYYWKGVALFHEAVFSLHAREEDRDSRSGERAVREGLDMLSRSIERNRAFSESYALRGVLRGMRIKQNAWTVPVHGPGVRSDRERALELDPENPRVHYLTGVSFWMAPEILGGSERALAHFLEAERLFDEEARRDSGPCDPTWGRSICLAFTGNYYAVRGMSTKAAAYYRKALRVNPNDALARKGLKKTKKTALIQGVVK